MARFRGCARNCWGVLALIGITAAACRGGQDAATVASPEARGVGTRGAAAPGLEIPRDAIGPDAAEYPYSYPVKYFEFRSQREALRMAYFDVAAEQPNGKTVVLLHGKNFSAEYWVPTIRSLTRAGFRVIAPDQLGFGKSSKPEAHQYSLLELAGNTRALLHGAGVATSAVVGHSMGGMLAARYAVTFPETVSKLVLVSPLGLEDYGAYLPYQSVDDWYRRELEQTPETIVAYQKRAYYGGQWKPEYAALAALQIGYTKHPGYPRIAYTSALTYDMIVTQPVVHDLPRIRAATLIIVGSEDRTAVGRDLVPESERARMSDFPKLARAAERAIPNARAVILDGVGHLPQVQAFDRYEQDVLGFLQGEQ